MDRYARIQAELLEKQNRVAEARDALRAAYETLPEKSDLAEVQRAQAWLAAHPP